MDPRGELLYVSPQCSKSKKAVIRTTYVFLIILGFFTFISTTVYYYNNSSIFLIGIGIFFVIIWLATSISSYLDPHFRIYENGITWITHHFLHPFGDCNKLELPSTTGKGMLYNMNLPSRARSDFGYNSYEPKEGFFIPWDNIIAFEVIPQKIYTTRLKNPGLWIHLRYPITKKYQEGVPIEYWYKGGTEKAGWKEAYNNLLTELTSRDIKRVPLECQSCGFDGTPKITPGSKSGFVMYKMFLPLRNCVNCGQMRY
ncbi:MAG: hypothetical protein JSV49_01140 [Thermoplasmata archaeon]|nr:MAG: hypothetical protein JSV49_01140 [Thermoplasmata archaeon]